jgi:hypothetical protein
MRHTSNICKIEGCGKKYHAKGYCSAHYMELWHENKIDVNKGRVEEKGRSQDHPLYKRWQKYKTSQLCERWLDFWNFVEDVSPQPENATKIQVLDPTQLVGPGNWKWSVPLKGELKNAYYRNLNKNGASYVSKRYYLKYGITLEEYDRLFKAQDGKCAICKQVERRVVNHSRDKESRRLSLDHCHKTGKIRGLLCGDCNPALGNLRDSATILKLAIQYLIKYDTEDEFEELKIYLTD